MKKYLLVIYGSTEDEARFAALSPEAMQAALQRYMAYSQMLRNGGHMVDGEGLSQNGRVLKLDGDRIAVTNGPLVQGETMIGGYFVIQAENLDQATELAQECPAVAYGATVEVREQMDY